MGIPRVADGPKVPLPIFIHFPVFAYKLGNLSLAYPLLLTMSNLSMKQRRVQTVSGHVSPCGGENCIEWTIQQSKLLALKSALF
jgi:hypothetical protein